MKTDYLDTKRLKLRRWIASDSKPFAAVNADPEVMKYFPKTLSEYETNIFIEKLASRITENGWGLWAVEIKATNEFIGFVGLNTPFFEELPFYPCTEIGWRLAKEYWGNGYATEAAQEVLKFAFEYLLLSEVIAFTPILNGPSQAVMVRIGMVDTTQNFLHPAIPANSELQEHVLFKITKAEWEQRPR